MIEALIFDFDGVIVETETPLYLTWQEVFHSYGVELDRALWQQVIGGGTKRLDVPQHLENLVGTNIDRSAIEEGKQRRYLQLISSSDLLPGVLDYILDAKRRGLKLGVASSSPREWVEGHLAERGLLEHFDSIVCRDDVSNVKPDPELFLTAVADLNTPPRNAVAIEDSANGVTAAKRAGLFCVVVPNSMTADMSLDHADIRLDDLSDMPLAALLEQAADSSLPDQAD